MREATEEAVVRPEEGVGHLGSTLIHDGRVVHLSLDKVRFPDGSEGELELIRHRGASAVVPFLGDPRDPEVRVVLVHQYRYAAGGYVYEIPAGIPMDGEDWEDCARRELKEETGYSATHLRRLTQIFTTPGFTNEEIHLFQAWGLEEGAVRRDRDEFMEVVSLPFREVLEMAGRGAIRDGKSLVGLFFADRFREEGA